MNRKQDFWRDHISAWQAGGLTQARYCGEHQLSLANFGYWRRKLKRTAVVGPADRGLIPIVPANRCASVPIEIRLRNGLAVHAPVSTEPARLVALVQALGAC